MGLEHAQRLVYALDPGTNPPKMGKEDCDSLMKPENIREITQLFPPFCNGAPTLQQVCQTFCCTYSEKMGAQN